MAQRRVGRAGRVDAPGKVARAGGLSCLAASLVCIAFATVGYVGQSDLRPLDRLEREPAQVVDYESGRGGSPDDLVVRFTPPGSSPRDAEIPYHGPARPGDTVEVAYVAAEPQRVRTVEGWYPSYQYWLLDAGVVGAVGVTAIAVGLVSRWRRSQYEEGVPAARPARTDPGLGRRVAVSDLRPLTAVVIGVGLLSAVPLAVSGLTQPDDRSNLLGCAAIIVVTVTTAITMLWLSGREGVWATSTQLVARHRGRTRHWSWQQVRELGLEVRGGTARTPAAKVDDGDSDGKDDTDWVPLARPVTTPLKGHVLALRMRELADEREIPYTEGLSAEDLLGGVFVGRQPRSRSRGGRSDPRPPAPT